MGYRIDLLRDYVRVFGPTGLGLAAWSAARQQPGTRQIVPPGAQQAVSIRLGTSDVPTYREVFIQHAYRLDLRTPPAVIVDAGANIGLTSIYFALRYPTARIIAVEPEASNVALLTANTAPYPQISVVHGAIWNANTAIDVVDPGLGKWGFRTSAHGERQGIAQVRGMTIDALMQEHGIDVIDVLKIDIEGAECEVLAEPSAWIDRVGAMVIELHERFRPGCNRTFYRATSGFDLEWTPRERSVAIVRDGMLASTPPGSAPVRADGARAARVAAAGRA